MTYKTRHFFPEKKHFSPDFAFQGDGVSFFYTYIRKNASTSFKKLFQLMHPGLCPGKTPSLGCMAKYAQVKDLSPEEIDRSFTNKVFIYRDPIERVFSVYKNKLIQRDGAEDLLDKLRKVTGRDPGLMTFSDFVNEYVSLLETERWREVDGHLYPQAWHLLPITYNMVIPMENVYGEMLKLLPKELCDQAFREPSNSTKKGSVPLENCDVDTPAVYFEKKYIQGKALPELNQVITPAIETRLKEIYCEDFSILESVSLNKKVETSFPQSAQHQDNYSRLLVKLESKTLEHESLGQELSDVKEHLDTVNAKYSDACQQIVSLQKTLDVANADYKEINTKYEDVFAKYSDACQQMVSLQEKLDVASADYKEINTKYEDVFAKYRAANAKYRSASQQLSALRSSQAYKAASYIRAASRSLTDAVKLPVRLWRLRGPKKKQPKQRMNLQQGLRYTKWKVVVPLATRLGVPYNKVAYLTLPQSVRSIVRRFKHQSSQAQQTEEFTPPSAAAQEISILGWPEYSPNGKPYVIGIMDEFTTGCFEQEVNLIQPRPDNWYALAEKYQPAFFFIESAWKGNYGSWQYRVADYANKPGQEVAYICQYAREKGIPTLFWNKEDPVHHDKFMCSAKLVDHIFTTDANMKGSYQAKTGNQNVHALPFAAQPALHKPAPLAGRKPRSCFAGSWYGNRHAERGQAMRWLLQAANRHGLNIYDRNHGTGIFPFPEEYQAGIKGSLPYKELCDEYSRYRVFLNVNSVTDSPTMFSRRVFELMACGTPVVSTYAKGIENLFESDAVWLVNSQEEADEAIRTLMTDDAEWRRRSLAGIREVFAKHTYAHRLNDIFVRLGIESRLPTDPTIALVAEAHSQVELEALDRFARQQRYRAFRLGIACSPGIATLAGTLSERIVLLQPGQKATWMAEQQKEHPIAGWVTPYGHYGEHYLRDLANATLYEPDAVGWAKALGQDHFAYGGQAVLAGALWQTREFLKQPIKAHPDDRLARSDLYLADSDQFQPGDVAPKKVVGG
ncbi:glycosyltransferase family protein [Halomonas cerina]|uniref:Spore protein YkvP/CgeB glycosyl transferase-like domain-containing protein n=1 Tax=Halomonas cerina TaxID=447424 RepID=A0A839VE30_9GAMM|nr:glycosyltransferase [Halomonas cerina]MBB3192210.1 hypothetical protein [Halomonas cerina]